MKERFTILTLILLISGSILELCAAPVDVQTARIAAQNFYNTYLNPSQRGGEPVLAYQESFQSSRGNEENTSFYVFNFGSDGFVIVSADDKVRPVLGFSTEGAFNNEQMGDNVAFFLGEYTREIQAVVESENTDNRETSRKWGELLDNHFEASRDVVVGPLITSKWGQGQFYNDLCPADASSINGGGHALVGCGAIVMGQLMRYWGYPIHGIGSHSYSSTNYGTLSANFADATYNYSLMPNKLSGASSDAQINAVATLLYHCGVSVDMNYGANASWSNSNRIVSAFKNYFGYPATIVYKERSYYSDDEWMAFLKGELDDGAPLLYGGTGTQGGHVFLCDGYRDDDYFHINWGLSGQYDGYFLNTELNPGPYSFSSSQAIIIGIRRPEIPEGIADQNNLAVSIFPNPASSTLTIETEAMTAEKTRLRVSDLSGRCILTEQMQGPRHELNISGLANGLYLLSIEGEKGHAVRKFIVE